MPISIVLVLLIAALIIALVSAAGKCPLWVAVVLAIIANLLQVGVR